MNKIIEIFKKKYKILIPIMVVIVLLVTLYFLYKEYLYDNTRNKVENTVFQYIGGLENEYTLITTYNLNDVIVEIEDKSKNVEFDSTPIYFKDNKKVLFPNEMTMAFPLRDGSQYKLFKYGIYEKKGEANHIINQSDEGDYSYFFMFDGQGLYFFPDEVTLYINDKEYKKLSSMSYVSVVGGYTMSYFDYDTKETKVIELNNDTIVVKSENINVNLLEHYFMSFSKKVLLLPPYNLNSLYKTD